MRYAGILRAPSARSASRRWWPSRITKSRSATRIGRRRYPSLRICSVSCSRRADRIRSWPWSLPISNTSNRTLGVRRARRLGRTIAIAIGAGGNNGFGARALAGLFRRGCDGRGRAPLPQGHALREVPQDDDVPDALHPAVRNADRAAPLDEERIRLPDEDSIHGAVVHIHDQIVHVSQEHAIVGVYLEPDDFGQLFEQRVTIPSVGAYLRRRS